MGSQDWSAQIPPDRQVQKKIVPPGRLAGSILLFFHYTIGIRTRNVNNVRMVDYFESMVFGYLLLQYLNLRTEVLNYSVTSNTDHMIVMIIWLQLEDACSCVKLMTLH